MAKPSKPNAEKSTMQMDGRQLQREQIYTLEKDLCYTLTIIGHEKEKLPIFQRNTSAIEINKTIETLCLEAAETAQKLSDAVSKYEDQDYTADDQLSLRAFTENGARIQTARSYAGAFKHLACPHYSAGDLEHEDLLYPKLDKIVAAGIGTLQHANMLQNWNERRIASKVPKVLETIVKSLKANALGKPTRYEMFRTMQEINIGSIAGKYQSAFARLRTHMR